MYIFEVNQFLCSGNSTPMPHVKTDFWVNLLNRISKQRGEGEKLWFLFMHCSESVQKVGVKNLLSFVHVRRNRSGNLFKLSNLFKQFV